MGLRSRISVAIAAICGAFSFRDVAMIVGLLLLAYGLSLVFWPATFIIPGAILVAQATFGVK